MTVEHSQLVNAEPSGKVLKGVSGWLLLLCLSLTIVSPFFQGKIAFEALRNLTQQSSPTLESLRLLVVGAVYFGLCIFSFWAGLWLWLEDVRGVSWAKAYLIASTVIVIVLFSVLSLLGVRVHLSRVIFRRVTYAAVWLCYLTYSRRVHDTYSQPT